VVAGVLYLFVPALLKGVPSPTTVTRVGGSSCQQAARAAAVDADDPGIDPSRELTNRRSLITDCDTPAAYSLALRRAHLLEVGQDPLDELSIACLHDLKDLSGLAICQSVRDRGPVT
jgi:hypothetical protein